MRLLNQNSIQFPYQAIVVQTNSLDLLGIQRIASAQLSFERPKVCTAIERIAVPATIRNSRRAIATNHLGIAGEIGCDAHFDVRNVEALVNRVIGFAAEKRDLTEHLFEGEIVIGAPQPAWKFKLYKLNIFQIQIYCSAISCTRSKFFVSHTTIAGKSVSQSR